MEQRYISVAQAASYLGCSKKTIYKLFSLDKLTPYRLSKRCTRIDRHEVDALVLSGRLLFSEEEDAPAPPRAESEVPVEGDLVLERTDESGYTGEEETDQNGGF